MLIETVSLLLPQRCVACGVAGAGWCAACARSFAHPPWPHSPRPRPPGLPPLWTAASYAGAVRAALIGYKDRGRRDLCAPLAVALAGVVRAAMAGVAAGGPVALVPVPSRRAAARRRGGDHVLRLARAARGLLGGGTVTVCSALRPVGRAADSVGLSAAQRLASRDGSMAVRRAYVGWLASAPQPPPVVLVDDLVTTGATLAAAAAALRAGGVRVTAAAVIAATERNQRRGLF